MTNAKAAAAAAGFLDRLGDLPIEYLPSVFFDDRAPGSVIDTLVIHSMYSDSKDPRDFFSLSLCKDLLDQYQVSAHFAIEREGKIWQMVPLEKRAWHAGVSRIPDPADGRESVNHFSVGLEIIAAPDSGYTDSQMSAVVGLTAELCIRLPIRQIYGHQHIAPDRKTDPWGFDWRGFRRDLLFRAPVLGRLRWPQGV